MYVNYVYIIKIYSKDENFTKYRGQVKAKLDEAAKKDKREDGRKREACL